MLNDLSPQARKSAEQAEHYAAMAFAHFLTGMMKADGHVSLAEETKVVHLLYQYRDVLPGQANVIVQDINAIKEDPAYKNWSAHQHMEQGFISFDDFVSRGGLHLGYMLVLSELLNIVMEVDGIDEDEVAYLRQMKEEVMSRYNRNTV